MQCRNTWASPPLLLPGGEEEREVFMDCLVDCGLFLQAPDPLDMLGAGGRELFVLLSPSLHTCAQEETWSG